MDLGTRRAKDTHGDQSSAHSRHQNAYSLYEALLGEKFRGAVDVALILVSLGPSRSSCKVQYPVRIGIKHLHPARQLYMV